MSDPNRPLSEVPALMEERHRYEAWLAALDARRDSTPEHVFQRVQADYRSRLDRVDERLDAHRQSIQEERASLESRLSLLKAEEQLRRDEHAELELRSHVGELFGAEAESAFRAVNDVIAQLVSEKDELLRQIGELDVLLQVRPRATLEPAPAAPAARQPESSAAPEPREPRVPRESRESREIKAAPDPVPGGSFDELAFLSEVVGGKGQVSRPAPAPPAPAAASAPAPAAAPAPAPQPKAQPWSQPPTQPRPQPPSSRISQATTISRDESASESLLSGLNNGTLRPSNEPPFAANVSGNMPIVLRTSGSTEQAKTLKCAECSTMNYPTEWYCERCGAELAAL